VEKNKYLISQCQRKYEREKYDDYYYDNEYWKEDLKGKHGNKGRSYNDPNHFRRFSFLSKLLMKYFDFKNFLDAGCGMGILVDILNQNKINSFGFDVSKFAFKHARLNNNSCIINGSIECIPFKNSNFDLVFCSDVLEHIPCFDIRASIIELSRVSKKFIVATINMDNPYLYHPTILSRSSWNYLFKITGTLKHKKSLEQLIETECKEVYPEYEFFVYEKIV